MIKAIIVDDEERGILGLQKLIENYCPEVSVVGTARNVKAAALAIETHKPDVVFLDIEMPEGNGFDLLTMFKTIDFEIIFVTAFEEYAIKAIKFAALEYLLKPVKISELEGAVEKLKKRKGNEQDHSRYDFLRQSVEGINAFHKMVLSTGDNFHFVSLKDIIYCKAEDNYTRFVMKDDHRLIVSRQLKEYEELLGGHNFFRIHKTYLINMNHVKKVVKKESASVIMTNQEELPVSFRKKSLFFTLLKDLEQTQPLI